MPAKSKDQQQFFGAVLHCKRTGEGCEGEIGEVAKQVSIKTAEEYAGTKHSEVDEQSTINKPTFLEYLQSLSTNS